MYIIIVQYDYCDFHFYSKCRSQENVMSTLTVKEKKIIYKIITFLEPIREPSL